MRRHCLLSNWRFSSSREPWLPGRAAWFHDEGVYRGDAGRGTRGGRCRVHHLRIQNRWPADVRHAAGFRRRTASERAFFHVAAPAENIAESVVVFRLLVGGYRGWIGFVFQTFVIDFWSALTCQRFSPRAA